VDGEFIGVALDDQRLFDRILVLLVVEKAEFPHAAQYVLLAQACALRVDDRVEGGRRLGQAGQHRRFGRRDVLERLAVIDLRGRAETVGALAEVNLVDIEFEDLVLAQVRFDLERQQGLVQFPCIGLFRGQEKVLGDLLCDGRRALLLAAADEIAGRGPDDAERIDATVLIEALVFGRQDGLLHDLGDVLDMDDLASFFPELSDQIAVGGEDAQRNLWAIIGQNLERREVRIGEYKHHGNHRGNHRQGTDEQENGIENPARDVGQGNVRIE